MTTNNKFMLSMATIAILSGASVALGDELKVDTADNKLKLGATEVKIEGSVANVKPDTGNESNAIEVKSELKKVDGMSSLTINAPKAEVKIGDGTTDAKASIGGTAPTDGAVSADGYGFTIDASKASVAIHKFKHCFCYGLPRKNSLTLFFARNDNALARYLCTAF